DHHPARGDQVPAAGGAGVRPLPDPEDEEREGDDVAGGDEVAVLRQRQRRCWDHFSASPGGSEGAPPGASRSGSVSSASFGLRSRPLNMPSIRSVTRKPPTMLIVPKAIAMTPMSFSSGSLAYPITISPPSMTIPWMAFVCDISGVCRVVGTFEITSKPTNAARTKIVISVIKLMTMRPPWLSR